MKTREEIYQIISDILVQEFELPQEKVQFHARLREDLELDSLDYVDLIAFLQRAFNVKLRSEERVKQVKTIEDIVTLIENLIKVT